MKFQIEYSQEKNQILKETRGVGFEEAEQEILADKIIDEFKHKNKKKYPKQRVFILNIRNYIYAVPYVKDEKRKVIFLKTIYPSRMLTKKYLGEGRQNEK